MITSSTEITAFVNAEIIPYIHDFRTLQDETGRIVRSKREGEDLLYFLRSSVEKAYRMVGATLSAITAFNQDVDLWFQRGLDTPPAFDRSLAAYTLPDQNSLTFFVAPLTLTNGPIPHGAFLECFVAYRDEPQEVNELSIRLPSLLNICQSYRLLTASKGLLSGNCLVVFPENVSTSMKVTSQPFAFSFSSKFQSIFMQETLPRALSVFSQQKWASQYLSSNDYYKAHCMWSYLHEYFHQQGPRPLHANFLIKMKFFTGILEEIKVDAQTILYAYKNKCVFYREMCEFILLERLLRYPFQVDANTNFDAGAGLLLFTWLLQEKSGLYLTQDTFEINIDECIDGLAALVEKIESIEQLHDDQEYRSHAKNFVRMFLPAKENNGRLAIPATYQKLMETIKVLT